MNITRGKKQTAIKTVIYGPEGIGKSTLAARFPGAVFMDTEGSTAHMDVARFDTPEKWMDIHEAIDWAIAHPEEIGTFIIDTADWAEKLAIRYVCNEEPIGKNGETRHWDNIEAPGYGKGYTCLKAAFQAMLDKLQTLVNKGVNVVITAHAILKKFEQPDEMGSYDRWSLKLNEKNVAPLVKEWADMVLFANYKTDVVKTSDGKTKGRGGQKRVMYTQHNACWDAKNRFGLEDQIPFEFEQIAHLFSERPEASERHEEAPAPEEKKPIQITPPQAEVVVGGVVPGIGAKPRKAKAKEDEKLKERPETMKSENAEKDAALADLWDKLVAAEIYDPLVLMAVVAEKDYYDITVKVRDYDIDFIRDVLIEAWDQVLPLCQTKANDLPF